MAYSFATTQRFNKTFKKHTKKNKKLREDAEKKIEKICKNPYLGKPLQKPLANKREEHVDSFIIIYKIEGEKVIFLLFEHHDYAFQH